jgi:hypothetical protein
MKQIKLSVERFWYERGNFELWPEALSRLPEKMEAASAREVSEKYLQRNSIEKGRLDRAREIYGLMGLHVTREGVPEIRGVALLIQSGKSLVLTREAENLVRLYRQGEGWPAALAGQLVKYSPRCRALLYSLWQGAVFTSKGKFPDKLSGVRLLYEDREYLPFNRAESQGMNQLLEEYKEEALGPYWKEKLANARVTLEADWRFTGVNSPLPTAKDLSSLMACPLDLFHYLGWFIASPGGEVRLDRDRVVLDLGEEPFSGRTNDYQDKDTIKETFKRLIEEHRDYRGYFPVEPVMEQLMASCPGWEGSKERFIDYFISQGVKNGDFSIADHHSGQPRHGRGYLGKRDYQLIKIIFHGWE